MLTKLIRELAWSVVGVILLALLICLGVAVGMSILLSVMGG